MKTFKVTEPFLHINCGLAESPFWEMPGNILRFVDIMGQAVYRISLDDGPASVSKQKYESSICVTADIEGEGDSFIFGGKYGIGIAKKSSHEMRYIKRFWNEEEEDGKAERMRANDGGVDIQGRFWSSALSDPETTSLITGVGVLFRLNPDGQLHRVLSNLTIPNGMSFSNRGRALYMTDTHDRRIYTYEYNDESGDLASRRIFFQDFDEGTGPDGHAQDANGNLWVAVWGAWKVICVSPQGQVTAQIELPTRCITAVAFAGEYVYVTSEQEKEPEKYPESVKCAGDIFRCYVGVRGRQLPRAQNAYLLLTE